jgi:Skp family chaperone for outer membrane proteins
MLLHILLALSLQTPGLVQPPTAVLDVQRLIAESTLGKAATARLRAFQAEQRKAIADKQAELQQLSRSNAARARIERAQLDLQRLAQDAEAALATLNQQLQEEFDKKLRPIVAELAEEEHIGIIFEVPHQTIVWVSPAIDVTSKVIERLEAASKPKP